MSVILVTDPTEIGYNSFVSLDEANEYFSGVYFGSSDDWSTLEEDDQAKLLITASRQLSTLSWTGVAQGNLAFPRIYSSYSSYNYDYGYEPTTPSFVKTLVCEWAKWLYQAGPDSDDPEDSPSITEVKVGELQIKYGESASSATALPFSIQTLLGPLSPRFLSFGRKARSMSMGY